MKLLISTDLHFSQKSSIIRGRGKKFSLRLENCINTLNWLEEISIKENCEEELFLGDMFDQNFLNAEEITALQEIKWNNKKKYFLVGNHEGGEHSLIYNSTNILKEINFEVIDKPTTYLDDCFFLPYITERDRKPLKEYLNNKKYKIIFSHNDIAGIFYNHYYESKIGFNVKEIEDNCDLYLNGHLHNGTKVTNKIINVGNTSGLNFTEDAFKHSHGCYILDTDTLEMKFIENPFAFNFYNIEINNNNEILKLDDIKENALLSIKCDDEDVEQVKNLLDNDKRVITYRLISYLKDINKVELTQETEIKGINAEEQLSNFVKETLGEHQVVKEELQEILK